MTEAIRHRGPDSAGRESRDFVDVGFRRLAIIDLAGGDQPFMSEDGSVACFLNGEIFNYKELRRDLRRRGHVFGTDSDTEVLPHLYEEHGAAMFSRLNGMFCVCVVDRAERRVLLARDQVGVKQMYYARVDGSIVFGSELKAVLASGLIEPRLEPIAVAAYLSLFYCPEPYTLVRGVKKIPPGCALCLSEGGARLERYHEFVPAACGASSPAEAGWRVRDLLKRAVEAQLQADVPVGISLSGGLDSSALAYAATLSDAPRPVALTISWPDTSAAEAECADRLCRSLDLEHEVIRPRVNEPLEELAELAWMSDEPIADPALYSQYVIARAAGERVKVLLSGAGGDELFGGYEQYVPSWKRRGFARLPAAMQTGLSLLGCTSGLDEDWRDALREYRESRFKWHCRAMSNLSSADRQRLMGGVPGSLDPFANMRELFAQYRDQDGASQQMLVDLRTYLPEQVLPMLDRATMAASIEGRVPFLDLPLTEFALSIPGKLKLGWPASPKRLLKHAVGPGIPEAILRRRKEGMPSPIAQLVESRHSTIAAVLLDPSGVAAAVLPRAWLVGVLGHPAAARQNFRVVYALLLLQVWHRLFIERREYQRPRASLADLFHATGVDAACEAGATA